MPERPQTLGSDAELPNIMGWCKSPKKLPLFLQALDSPLPKIMEWLKNPKKFLVFFGGSDTGKTFFLSALIEYIISIPSTCYWTEAKLLSQIRSSIEKMGDYSIAVNNATDDEFLIIDDFGSDWTEEILFSIVDTRYNSGKPTVLISDLSRKELEYYYPRLMSCVFSKENCIVDLSGMLC